MRFVPEPTFADRIVAHTEHAEAIARMAITLIEPGSTVFVNAGSTTLAFAHELVCTRTDLRVITNSINIAQITGPCEHLETLLLGGTPHAEVPATYGELTLSEIERFRADYAVISPVGFSALRGATDYALHEAEVARKMIRSARTCMILCYAEKLEAESRINICRPEEIDILITDERAGPGLALYRDAY
ncbi:MAG TPA: DeoR/GlpR transcriptional regulator [Paracoccus sp.]|nr:DeoR/GlpR transcriptional regulator [Paracoccus sp. (in: a-proteobacteria)]